jgi:hypothetical protein
MQPFFAEDDRFGIIWSDPRFLEQFPLLPESIIPYFSTSQFYSTDCTNSILTMNRVLPENLNSEMVQHKGRQYWLEDSWPKTVAGSTMHPIPRLYIISRQQRKSLDKTFVTGLYWVADGKVSQSPSLLSVLQTRMQNSVYHIHQAFSILENFAELDITDGNKWREQYADINDEKSDGNQAIASEGRADSSHMAHFIADFQSKYEPRINTKKV